MRAFLYIIGILAEAGIATTVGFLFWLFTGLDALEIMTADIMITLFASLLIFLKIGELLKEGKTK